MTEHYPVALRNVDPTHNNAPQKAHQERSVYQFPTRGLQSLVLTNQRTAYKEASPRTFNDANIAPHLAFKVRVERVGKVKQTAYTNSDGAKRKISHPARPLFPKSYYSPSCSLEHGNDVRLQRYLDRKHSHSVAGRGGKGKEGRGSRLTRS